MPATLLRAGPRSGPASTGAHAAADAAATLPPAARHRTRCCARVADTPPHCRWTAAAIAAALVVVAAAANAMS